MNLFCFYFDLIGPRLCQTNPTTLPCFTAMRTSSPTVVDAYQTAFLQCVVKNHNRMKRIFRIKYKILFENFRSNKCILGCW